MATYRKRDEGCCSVQFLKYALHIFNFIFLLTGCAVFAVGLWTVIAKQHYFSILNTSTYAATAYILITAGVIVFLVSILGCVGIVKEDRCCILAYTFLLLLIFLLEAVAGVIAYIYEEQVWSELQNTLNSTFVSDYKYDQAKTDAIDDLQRKYNCCGAESYKDWAYSRWLLEAKDIYHKVPDSCCITETLNCGVRTHPSNAYHRGCATALANQIKDNLIVLGAVGLGICLVQIIGMIFSCCLYVQLRDYDNAYY